MDENKSKTSSRSKGFAAESAAVDFLQKVGFEIIKTNHYCKGGEIDIIARLNDTLHFVEVKSGSIFEPAYAITPQKLSRITACAASYIATLSSEPTWCISAVFVRGEKIELVENVSI